MASVCAANLVRYHAVDAILRNEFLKEHRKNEEQGAIIARLQEEIAALKTELKEQTLQIQKSIAPRLELRESATRTVLNYQ